MFDNNVFKENTCVNVEEDGKVIGFEMQTNITYYRGIPMSMIEYIKVAVDGEEVPTEDIRISLEKEDWFTLEEAETVTDLKLCELCSGGWKLTQIDWLSALQIAAAL